MNIDRLVTNSDCALTGKVIDILPSRERSENLPPGFSESGMKMIYTDVIIKPEKYLFGGSDDSIIAVRVEGGRIDSDVLIVEDQPDFTVGDNVLLFLYHSDFNTIPQEIKANNYFSVKGLTQGAYLLKDQGYINQFSKHILTLDLLEKKISELR